MWAELLAISAMGLASASQPASPAQPPMNLNERAYTITLVCYVISANDQDDAGNARALDAARRMATANGYSNQRLSHDLITMASVVGVQSRDEPATVERNRGVCRQLGLLS